MSDDRTNDILDARHLVATAAGNIAACSAQVARALAWQRGQEVSVIADLETTIAAVDRAHRQLIDAVNELRIATRKR
jgi:ferric-dicitrate binding protein FerR (iron transport regulator)